MIGVSEADISPPVVMMASTLVRMAHPSHENLHNALSKAESRLFTHAWTVSGGVLQIESESNVGHFRHTDGDTCDCPTRKYICWHRGAYFILSVLAAASIAPLKSASVPLVERGPMTPAAAAAAAAAADDPAMLGNFLDRPEFAGNDLDDVSFATEPPLDLFERDLRDLLAICKAAAAESYARSFAEWEPKPGAMGRADEYAYGRAYHAATARGATAENAHKIAAECMQEHHTTPVVPRQEQNNTPPKDESHRIGERITIGTATIEVRDTDLLTCKACGAHRLRWYVVADGGIYFCDSECESVWKTPPPPPLGRRSTLDDGKIARRARIAAGIPAADVLWDTSEYSEEENDEKIVSQVKGTQFHATTGGPPDPFE